MHTFGLYAFVGAVPRSSSHARSVRGTVIGDDFLRGVSGGEKKRVTIAEAMMGQLSVVLLDDYTSVGWWRHARLVTRRRGSTRSRPLRSSSRWCAGAAFTRSLTAPQRIFARTFGIAVIAAQSQPSQEMFELFDKALLLSEGQCAYFGSPSDALPYFERALLPRRCAPQRRRPWIPLSGPPQRARLPCVLVPGEAGGCPGP